MVVEERISNRTELCFTVLLGYVAGRWRLLRRGLDCGELRAHGFEHALVVRSRPLGHTVRDFQHRGFGRGLRPFRRGCRDQVLFRRSSIVCGNVISGLVPTGVSGGGLGPQESRAKDELMNSARRSRMRRLSFSTMNQAGSVSQTLLLHTAFTAKHAGVMKPHTGTYPEQ